MLWQVHRPLTEEDDGRRGRKEHGLAALQLVPESVPKVAPLVRAQEGLVLPVLFGALGSATTKTHANIMLQLVLGLRKNNSTNTNIQNNVLQLTSGLRLHSWCLPWCTSSAQKAEHLTPSNKSSRNKTSAPPHCTARYVPSCVLRLSFVSGKWCTDSIGHSIRHVCT